MRPGGDLVNPDWCNTQYVDFQGLLRECFAEEGCGLTGCPHLDFISQGQTSDTARQIEQRSGEDRRAGATVLGLNDPLLFNGKRRTQRRVNPAGNSGDPNRGNWCTPKWLADLIGTVDVDPCSNTRSHIDAHRRCYGKPEHECGLELAPTLSADCVTFINPPYHQGSVLRWVAAYSHTDFIFLLRFDPSTEWFSALISHTSWVWFPTRRRINFEPPPGVKASSQTFPHALFCKSTPNEELRANGYIFTR